MNKSLSMIKLLPKFKNDSWLPEQSANQKTHYLPRSKNSKIKIFDWPKKSESFLNTKISPKISLKANKKSFLKKIGRIEISNIQNVDEMRSEIYDQIQKAIEAWNTRETYLGGKGKLKLSLKIIPNTEEDLKHEESLVAKNLKGFEGEKKRIKQVMDGKIEEKLGNLKEYLGRFVDESVGTEVSLLGKRAFSALENS